MFVYPKKFRQLADLHFTPLSVAKTAASFLVTHARTKVLDVGAGAGKFCLVGACTTQGVFTGIEQREELVDLSSRIARQYQLANVSFIHANVMSIDFTTFDAVYFFNPFYENMNSGKQIDDAVLMNPALFRTYTSYVYSQLEAMKAGTRLVTYYSSSMRPPHDYELVNSGEEGNLLMWQKRVGN